jgi:hypothetical protein
LDRFAFLLSLVRSVLALVFVLFLLGLLASTCILKMVRISEVREALAERIRYLRVCSPAPGRHRKQKRCLPVREVKRKQRCIGSRVLMLLAAAGLAAGHLERSLLLLCE